MATADPKNPNLLPNNPKDGSNIKKGQPPHDQLMALYQDPTFEAGVVTSVISECFPSFLTSLFDRIYQELQTADSS
jgi:hypothetical protein